MNIKKVFDNRILYIDDEMRAEYSKGSISLVHKSTEKSNIRIHIYDNWLYKIASHVPLLERLLRLEPRYMEKVDNNTYILSNSGALLKIDVNTAKTSVIFKYAKGTKNPLSFCSYIRKNECEIVFGDYGGHDSQGNVGVYVYKNNCVKEIASIPGNIIDHIHRVEYDKYRDCYWIFTGDSDEGSAIWRLEVGNHVPAVFVHGNQQYRACVAHIQKKSIIYATDTPISGNSIYEVSIDDKSINKMTNMPGSCIYGASKNGWFIFATTVEPDSTLPTIRYRLTNKLGSGIKDRYSHLIAGNKEVGFKEIWKTKKDWLPMWLFQFGNIRFPVQHTNELYFCPQSCKAKGTYCINHNN